MNSDIKTVTIMVVDDTVDNLNVLRAMLRGKGYRVVVFPDGAMALNAAIKNPPDLILLDIRMPGMDGYAVCQHLKAEDSLKDVPVIFISALDQTVDKVKAFAVGGVDYVTKPFQLEEVHSRVTAHLEIRLQKLELQESYRNLRELESLRDGLVHMIVHDMRTPLSGLLGYLDLAMIDPLPDRALDSVKMAIYFAEKIQGSISNMLDTNKLEAGQLTPECSLVQWNSMIEEVTRMVGPLLGKRTLSFISPDETKTLRCDEQLIKRVLQNLLSNSLKFTDSKNGAITVSVHASGADMIRISVSDNGKGVSAEYRDRVFDKYFQVEARQQGKSSSSGLGLTFCKLAVEAHGGRIGVDSEIDKGSTFWFELPIA